MSLEKKFVLKLILKKISEILIEKYAECEVCNTKQVLKRHYDNKDRLSSQRKKYCEKNREEILQRHEDKYMHFKDLVSTFVGLENR